jgi:predicted transposase/invertase (TIGR01784 family)
MAVSKFLDPKNDVAFKKIFGSEKNKDILIHFINDIMGFTGGDQIQDVTFLSPIQDPEIAYKKQSIVDVLCKSENGTKIIVEMQVSPSKGFEKRAQYYAAKAYGRQLNMGKKTMGYMQI